MVLDDLYSTYLTLKNDNLSFIYQGDFSDDITSKIINLSEYNISNISELSKMKKKVSLIMVECFQNIIRHGDEIDKKSSTTHSRMFIARNIGSNHYITSANLIENENIPLLKEKLERINKLNKDELKALYLEILSNDDLSEKGGAGLGLIEMARKSGEKLEYDFTAFNDKLSYFYLQSKILGSEETNCEAEKYLHIPISIARNFHLKVISWNILMVYKGDFSQTSIMPMLKMIENNMSNQFDELKVKKLVYIALVEILQNISKHSKDIGGLREGIFLMGQKNKNYVISSGNLISNAQVPSLKKQLDYLNSLDKNGLNEFYKKTLLSGEDTYNGGAGLGLIDIARESDGKLEYNFVPFDKNTSFFSLIVRV